MKSYTLRSHHVEQASTIFAGYVSHIRSITLCCWLGDASLDAPPPLFMTFGCSFKARCACCGRLDLGDVRSPGHVEKTRPVMFSCSAVSLSTTYNICTACFSLYSTCPLLPFSTKPQCFPVATVTPPVQQNNTEHRASVRSIAQPAPPARNPRICQKQEAKRRNKHSHRASGGVLEVSH